MHYFVFILVLQSSKLVALLLLSNRCFVTVNILWFYLTPSWVGLQCLIVVFPDHTHLLFCNASSPCKSFLRCRFGTSERESYISRNIFGTKGPMTLNFGTCM